MMASYAQMMRRYMSEYGAPAEAFAQVSVKAHKNASMNPYAHHKKVFTLEDVLNSRMISDPLTLFQCCPTSEGGSAAIICAREVADKYIKNPDRLVTIAGAGLRTSKFGGSDEDDAIASAGREAYEISGVGPQDVDVVQVHDAGTSGELLGIESLKLVDKGQAWKLEMSGDTEIDGSLPVNTDGGLQGMGHPFGATGIRMIHELVTQLNGEAGDRQVKKANIGLAQCSGAGGIATVFLLRK
jgi:acetyl-CoA acetyltransferase